MLRDLFYGVSEQGKAGKQRMDDARALLNAVREESNVADLKIILNVAVGPIRHIARRSAWE